MARNRGPDGVDLPDVTDPSEVADSLEPEVVDGPLGLPVVKPKGAPNPPGTESDRPY